MQNYSLLPFHCFSHLNSTEAFESCSLLHSAQESESSSGSLKMDFVLPRAHTFADVAATGLSHQPQWDTRGVFFRYGHTQSVWGALPTAKQDPQAAEHLCTTCVQVKSKCACSQCFLCKTSVGFGTRHHCRKCWKATCKNCRLRVRYVNPLVENSVAELTCDQCAVLKGISSLDTADGSRIGLQLLWEAADMPRFCVGATCSTFTYLKMCPCCNLPTVPKAPYVERLVRVEYCCRWSRKCAQCVASEKRMKELETEARASRETQFLSSEKAYAAEGQELGKHVRSLLGLDATCYVGARAENLLLAAVCSSVCYEYAYYPAMSLQLSDVPHSKYLVLRETSQLYSTFEGPNRTLFVALPGTHDLRTVLTDAQFSRVVETQVGDVCGGVLSNGRMLHCGTVKLWEYKVHSGFLAEEMKLRTVLSTASLRRYVEEGWHIVFSGHSLGGALAILLTLRVLSEDLAAFNGRVTCVTVGAPFVGNSALTRKVQRCGWEKYFHHFVYRADIVPRLLCAHSVPKEIVQQLQDHVSATVQSVQNAVQNFFRGRKGSKPPGSEGTELTEQDERGNSEPQPVSDEPTMKALLFGAKRPFDTFGHYHFLFKDLVPYLRLSNPSDSFNTLRRAAAAGGSSSQLTDHLLDSYNKAISQLLRQEEKKNDDERE